jgi:hypothetical protein
MLRVGSHSGAKSSNWVIPGPGDLGWRRMNMDCRWKMRGWWFELKVTYGVFGSSLQDPIININAVLIGLKLMWNNSHGAELRPC